MVHRCLFLRCGLNGGYKVATFLQDEERPLLCLATDQVENHIDLLSQNLLELRLSIIENPAGPDGVEVRLIVAACRGNDGGAGMRCQLHRIGAHSAGATMDQDRLSLFQVTLGEESLPRSLGGHRHRCCKGPLPVNTIGPIVDLTPGSISIAVDRLFAKGLVTRVESTEDRRVRIIALTPRGKDLIVSAFRKHSGQMKRVLSELSPEELRGLEVKLKKVGKRAAALMEES